MDSPDRQSGEITEAMKAAGEAALRQHFHDDHSRDFSEAASDVYHAMNRAASERRELQCPAIRRQE